jgi:Na+/H+ antiporter NhaD/arsenite permease-like protein
MLGRTPPLAAALVVAAPILVYLGLTAPQLLGANTYIGNAPNLMVKAIADESGVKMPSFFGYMAYSVGILIPPFVVVSLLLF